MVLAKDYKDLQIWQKADSLAHGVYLLTRLFPSEERFNLTSQLTRAALSVPTNIVEGFYRTPREFIHFVVIAFGSPKETEYLLDVAVLRQYIAREQTAELKGTIGELSKMMAVFIKSLTRSLVR